MVTNLTLMQQLLTLFNPILQSDTRLLIVQCVGHITHHVGHTVYYVDPTVDA